MSVRMNRNLCTQYRLETPQQGACCGSFSIFRARKIKSRCSGRKLEQDRQADVKANFEGDRRPAPVVGDKVKLEELKKRAMSGDKQAQAEWFKARGII
jgi:hypothetical protein